MEQQKIVSASDFKAHCLEYLEKIRLGNMEFIVTKRGQPIAKLTAIENNVRPFVFGSMKGLATIHKDIIAPIDVDWGI